MDAIKQYELDFYKQLEQDEKKHNSKLWTSSNQYEIFNGSDLRIVDDKGNTTFYLDKDGNGHNYASNISFSSKSINSIPSITKKYLTKNKYSRPGTKRSKTTKIAWHYTGGAKVPAINTWKYFESLKNGIVVNGRYIYASSQYIIGLNGEIYQLMPNSEIAYTTNQANSYSIGIECSHINNSGEYTEKEYRSMVWLGVQLAKEYNLNPKTDFIRHYDVTEKWCPMWFVKHPTAWKQFKQDCYDVLHGKDLDVVLGNAQEIQNRKDYDFKTKCKVVSVNDSLNVRDSRPVDGKLGEKLFDIPLGEELAIGYVLNNWAYIDYKGQNGFVNIKYLQIV